MEFINRKEELDFLNKRWQEKGAQLIPIYGKRRVGKTELTLQFIKDKPHIYFLSESVPKELQLRKFAEVAGGFFNDKFITQGGFRDWVQALEYLSKKKEKMVIIIDEFPYLVEGDPATPSLFQKGWDLYLKDSPLFIILLGSSIGMMERTTLFYRAPLYGRRTGQIRLQPFSFKQLKEAFEAFPFEERLTIYSIVGGMPPYINLFRRQKRNIWEVVKDQILTKGSLLYEEVEFLLREELKEPRNYFAILIALSLTKTKLSEILNETGFDKGTVSRYLSILQDLQIVTKEVPVTEKVPQKSRKGLYRIEDNFFNFWFRFIFRNRDLLEEGKKKEVLKMVKRGIGEILSRNYEKISLETLKEAVSKRKLPIYFTRYGRWWEKGEEIDIVAVNQEQNKILFGEVKWSNRPVGTNIYKDLKQKAQKVISKRRPKKKYFCLFSKTGFTQAMLDIAKEEGVFLFEKDSLIV
ncbi:MAG: ATP-binding protein [bacterium]